MVGNMERGDDMKAKTASRSRPKRPVSLADNLPIELLSIQVLGRATVLDLRLNHATVSIAIEPPKAPSPFGRTTVVVPDAKSGAAFLGRIGRWLRVGVPPQPNGTTVTPPPAEIGAVALQTGADEDGVTWHRTKLCFGGVEELYLLWPESGSRAWLSEKDAECRDSLIEALTVVLRDGRRPAPRESGRERGPDPLRSDPIPLVSSLLRMHRRPVSVVGSFWRGDRFVFAEFDGKQTAIIALGIDGLAEKLATVDAPVRYLHEAGPHIVASVEYPRNSKGENARELWIVRSGERIGHRLLAHDPEFDPGQMATPVASSDGELLAVGGRGYREGEGCFDSVRILDPMGGVVAELSEGGTNLGAETWSADGLELVADRFGEPDGRRHWDVKSKRLAPILEPSKAGAPRQFTVGVTGRNGLEVHAAGGSRQLGRLRKSERELLAKYGERSLHLRYFGDRHAIIDVGDRILLDCETLRTWVIVPSLAGATNFNPDLTTVALLPYGGGLLIGRVDDRWRTGAPPPGDDPAEVSDRLRTAIKGNPFIFDGVGSRVVPADWAAKLSLSEAEVVNRLEAAGRSHVAEAHRAIDSAIDQWRTELGSADGARNAATKAASLDVPGAPGLVWATIAYKGAAAIEEDALVALRAKLKRLAAESFVDRLQHDGRVREGLGLPAA